jgi:hypothetical protein
MKLPPSTYRTDGVDPHNLVIRSLDEAYLEFFDRNDALDACQALNAGDLHDRDFDWNYAADDIVCLGVHSPICRITGP